MAEGEAGEVAIGEDGFVAVLGLGRPDGLAYFVDPVLAAHFFGALDGAELGFVDVGVGVEDLVGDPVFEVVLPEVAVDVGVLPDVVEGDGLHGVVFLWEVSGWGLEICGGDCWGLAVARPPGTHAIWARHPCDLGQAPMGRCSLEGGEVLVEEVFVLVGVVAG